MKISVAFVLAFGLAGTAADAQVVQRYTYDANGRLIGATSSVYGSGVSTTYTLDDADNRTSRTRTSGAYARLAEDDTAVAAAQPEPGRSEPVDVPPSAPPPATPAENAPAASGASR